MASLWKDPRIIIGAVATGNNYFARPLIEDTIWAEIEKGNHVLLAAPRRVGKSSVLRALADKSPKDTRSLFKNIQGVESEEEFYKTFFEALVTSLDKFKKGANWLQKMLGGITIEEITLDGVKFGTQKSINYAEEIDRLLPKIADQEIKIVLLLDELPEVLNNLYKNGKQGEATNILNRLRQWRQHPEILQHLQMVLAGSVGLHHIVKTIEGRTADINDLIVLPFAALTEEEAYAYLKWATEDATVQYEEDLSRYLLAKVRYFVPYYLNLMLDKINRKARQKGSPEIGTDDIDKAFDLIIKDNLAFRDWYDRINEYFNKEESAFLNEVLVYIAHKETINVRELYDLAKKHQLTNEYMQLVSGLERDGYIFETDQQTYQFISPFLKASWLRNHPIYE